MKIAIVNRLDRYFNPEKWYNVEYVTKNIYGRKSYWTTINGKMMYFTEHVVMVRK